MPLHHNLEPCSVELHHVLLPYSLPTEQQLLNLKQLIELVLVQRDGLLALVDNTVIISAASRRHYRQV